MSFSWTKEDTPYSGCQAGDGNDGIQRGKLAQLIPPRRFTGWITALVMTRKHKKISEIIYSTIVFLLIALTLLLLPHINHEKYTSRFPSVSSVTPADMEALAWLAKHTTERDLIQNNYGDAGLWIPAIIYRPITDAHVNIMYLHRLKELEGPKYVYVGKKCVYADSCPRDNSNLQNSEDHQLIYSKDQVYIYRILQDTSKK